MIILLLEMDTEYKKCANDTDKNEKIMFLMHSMKWEYIPLIEGFQEIWRNIFFAIAEIF